MEVIALVGASGTGKSHRAAAVAATVGASVLVDDGLLIAAGNIVSGRSAKREATKMAAVRRAIFQRDEDAIAARQALREAGPERVLIIGTSLSMVERIAQRLGLPAPARLVAIEEVSTPEEIALARHIRHTEGKHVIPAPTLQVKRGFSGYLVDPLRFLLRTAQGRSREVEKSIVRPTYSALGRFSIDDRAVAQVATIAALRAGVLAVHRVGVRAGEDGVQLSLDLELRGTHALVERLHAVQAAVAGEVEGLTALNVLRVDLVLRAVEVPHRRLGSRRLRGRRPTPAGQGRGVGPSAPAGAASAAQPGPPGGSR